MSWFNKSSVTLLRLSAADQKALGEAVELFSNHLRERFQGLDAETEELRTRVSNLEREVETLKKSPRESFAAKLRGKR